MVNDAPSHSLMAIDTPSSSSTTTTAPFRSHMADGAHSHPPMATGAPSRSLTATGAPSHSQVVADALSTSGANTLSQLTALRMSNPLSFHFSTAMPITIPSSRYYWCTSGSEWNRCKF